jgi:hypothetical protein
MLIQAPKRLAAHFLRKDQRTATDEIGLARPSHGAGRT